MSSRAAAVALTFSIAQRRAIVYASAPSLLPSTRWDRMTDTPLPLAGIRVVEFCHMLAGPTAGLLLGDLGADVIKVEPSPGGDKTRNITGGGSGFFTIVNRNKRSIMLDMKSAEGMATAKELIASADIMVENFRPGTMDEMGLGATPMMALNPKLIYTSVRGFLSGPYENRAALDEVVQMMTGLAYMTGPPGRPLRAGASVVDFMCGTFAVVAIQAALRQRDSAGKGAHIVSGLYETCAMLVAQHMMQKSITGKSPSPMPAREAAWGIYDVFQTSDEPLFVGVVTDTQWIQFCAGFGLADLAADARVDTNPKRCAARPWLIPQLAEVFNAYSRADLIEKVAAIGLPYAPIAKPEDLLTDPHLVQSGGLLDVRLADGRMVPTPAFPVEINGRRLKVRHHPPKAGEHNAEILRELKQWQKR
jgi:crotonobetainyl-CoA:carnitine CoA-transferase CaiB-like acyl-CoA transferase